MERVMIILDGFIEGLIVAWMLTLFNMDIMILEVLQPFVSVKLTTSHYYVLFAMIGLIGKAFGSR